MTTKITPNAPKIGEQVMTRTLVMNTITAYNAALDDENQPGGPISPNGDDFNDLIDAIGIAMDSGAVPTITVSHDGR